MQNLTHYQDFKAITGVRDQDGSPCLTVDTAVVPSVTYWQSHSEGRRLPTFLLVSDAARAFYYFSSVE